jgi:hypothetical protein
MEKNIPIEINFDSFMQEIISNLETEKLANVNYCNMLLSNLSPIISSNFNKTQLNRIYNRIENGLDNNSNDNIYNMNPKQFSIRIVKFYIKIAHAFTIVNQMLNENLQEIMNLTIPEIKHLYMDDKYNLKTNQFDDMSPESKSEYNENLNQFHFEFTGRERSLNEIQQFNDIKLHHVIMINIKYPVENPIENSDTSIFIQYAKSIKNLIHSIQHKIKDLHSLLGELFTSDSKIRSDLTELKLQHIIDSARYIIQEINEKCESEYLEMIQIYQAIAETRMMVTLQNQINHLQNVAEKLYVV